MSSAFVYILGILLLLLTLVALFLLPTHAVDTDEKTTRLTLLRHEYAQLKGRLAEGLVDTEEYAERLENLERAALLAEKASFASHTAPVSRPLIVACLGVISAISVASYIVLGSPWAANSEFLERHQQSMQSTQANAEAPSTINPKKMLAALREFETTLTKTPKDAEGWNALLESYAYLGEWKDVVRILTMMNEVTPGNPDTLASLADAKAVMQGMSLEGEPEKLIDEALAINPKHQKALNLKGSALFNRKDYAKAVRVWKQLLSLTPKDSDAYRNIEASIHEAEGLARQQR